MKVSAQVTDSEPIMLVSCNCEPGRQAEPVLAACADIQQTCQRNGFGPAMAGRAAVAVAGRLGTTTVTFPGGHDGFLGGEYGRTGDPDTFATISRKILTN